ncbi:MAG: hypothetical protein WBW67_20305 [Pseudolabrys sp.]
MVIVELKQPNYNARIEAIAQAVLASLRPGAATDKLLAVAVEMSTKLTTHIEDLEWLANDVLLAVWDRLKQRPAAKMRHVSSTSHSKT